MKCSYKRFIEIVLTLLIAFQGTRGGDDKINICTDLAIQNETLIDEAKLDSLIEVWCVKGKSSNFQRLSLQDSSAVLNTKLDKTLDVKFVVHGYQYNDSAGGYLKPITQSWANQGPNACYVLWTKLSNDPPFNYFQIVEYNIPEVAKYLANKIILGYLKPNGFKVNQMEMAGHSLGAHVVGQTAWIIKKNNVADTIQTAYGLDPAQPCFTFPQIVADVSRISAGCAKVVQCIHTNPLLAGQVIPCGCQDIYVNGIIQLQCVPLLANGLTGLIAVVGCSHSFAVTLFEWTIPSNQKCVAHTLLFLNSLVVGIRYNKQCTNLSYVLLTKSNPPYCT